MYLDLEDDPNMLDQFNYFWTQRYVHVDYYLKNKIPKCNLSGEEFYEKYGLFFIPKIYLDDEIEDKLTKIADQFIFGELGLMLEIKRPNMDREEVIKILNKMKEITILWPYSDTIINKELKDILDENSSKL